MDNNLDTNEDFESDNECRNLVEVLKEEGIGNEFNKFGMGWASSNERHILNNYSKDKNVVAVKSCYMGLIVLIRGKISYFVLSYVKGELTKVGGWVRMNEEEGYNFLKNESMIYNKELFNKWVKKLVVGSL